MIDRILEINEFKSENIPKEGDWVAGSINERVVAVEMLNNKCRVFFENSVWEAPIKDGILIEE